MIYAIQAGEGGPIKFGYSAESPESRLRDLQTAHFLDLRLLHVNEGEMEEEKEVHKICRRERIRGEWFKPEGNVLLVLKAMQENSVRCFLTRIWARDAVLHRGPFDGETVNAEFWAKRRQMANDPDLPKGEDRYEYHWLRNLMSLVNLSIKQPNQQTVTA